MPWFAFLAFYSVHAPIQTTQSLWRKYRDKALAAGNATSRFVWDRRLPVRTVQDCPIYAGMVEAMDEGVGLALSALERAGLSDKAIVCYTSDNGGVSSGDAFATSNLPLRGGKGRQWEGGYRVPFYIKAPGVTQPGSSSEIAVMGIDFYSTLLELAGIAVPAEQAVDGVSLVPLLRGGTLAPRLIFAHEPHYGNQGGEPASHVLRGDMKLILYHEDMRAELYDIRADVGEATDLGAEPAHQSTARELRAELDSWLVGTHARLPTPDPEFDAVGRAAVWRQRETEQMTRLEGQHAGFLDEGFEPPSPDWWDSQPGAGGGAPGARL